MPSLRFLPLLTLVACATPSAAPSPTPSAAPPPATSAVTPGLDKTLEVAIEAKDWKRALPLAQQFVAEQPRSWRAWNRLGLTQVGMNDASGALQAFENSLALDDNPQTRMYLAAALYRVGKYREALPHFERTVQMEPEVGAPWVLLARTQLELRMWDEAADSLARARQLMPEDKEVQRLSTGLAAISARVRLPREALAHHRQGGELVLQGRFAEAEAEYESALKISPEFADCHYNLGRLARQRGDLARAEQEYRAAIAGYPPQEALLRADALNNLADTLVARKGDASEAVRLVREAITVRGSRPSYVDTLARACDAQGDKDCAVASFRRLLAMEGNIPADVRTHAHKRLGELSP